MFKKFFKKEFTNDNFMHELFHENPKESWLEEALESGLIDINKEDEKKNTFLMLTLKRASYKSALWLIDNGADPTIQDKEYKTAIDIAIQKNKIVIVEELLKLKKLRQFTFKVQHRHLN